MLLIYTHSLNLNFENKSKKVLANSKRYAIIDNINQWLLDNKLDAKIEKFLKLV